MQNLSDIIQQTLSQTLSQRVIWNELIHDRNSNNSNITLEQYRNSNTLEHDRNANNTLGKCSWPPKYLRKFIKHIFLSKKKKCFLFF